MILSAFLHCCSIQIIYYFNNGFSSVSISDVANHAIATIASQIQADTLLDFSDETQLKTLLQDTATITGVDVSSISTEAAQVMAAVNQSIDNKK